MGFHGQLSFEIAPMADLGEVPPTHEEVWEGIPSEKITSRPDKVTSFRSGRSRSLLHNQLLLNSYILPQGPTPPLGLECSQEIINRWKPFNRGESPSTYLEQL